MPPWFSYAFFALEASRVVTFVVAVSWAIHFYQGRVHIPGIHKTPLLPGNAGRLRRSADSRFRNATCRIGSILVDPVRRALAGRVSYFRSRMCCHSCARMLPVPLRRWRCLRVFRDDLQMNYCFPMLHCQNPMYSHCSRQTPPKFDC